ncbi:ParB-like protein [Leptospira interrogans serovar Bataviae str. HAI135]|nr:ParB-like protein [Leptospira interrogans serovar Bataviae str. HAI135]
MKIRVSDIKVKNRIRKDLGDLQSLKESIQKLGLLHPILIDLENTLISGERRLESVKILGWEYVDVRIVDIRNKKKEFRWKRRKTISV